MQNQAKGGVALRPYSYTYMINIFSKPQVPN